MFCEGRGGFRNKFFLLLNTMYKEGQGGLGRGRAGGRRVVGRLGQSSSSDSNRVRWVQNISPDSQPYSTTGITSVANIVQKGRPWFVPISLVVLYNLRCAKLKHE